MIKNILLVTNGIFHPPFFGRMALHKSLAELDGFRFKHVSSLEQLPADIGSFSALVLHYHHQTISDAALQRLDVFVKRGGGILALHAATASFKETLPYFKILGGRFIEHGAVEDIEIRRVKDGIFDGIDLFTVQDELYIHELQPGVEFHFVANHQGQDVPVVWTYDYGNGRVCYAVPGHTTGSMKHPSMQEIVRRGLVWVCQPGSQPVHSDG